MQIDAEHITFISDTHFKNREEPGEAKRRDAFKAFLETVPGESILFLLGDIFDFYFEYKSVIHSRYFDIFHALYNARSRDIELHFLGGNHDSWTGRFLTREIGVTVHQEKVLFASQGRKILCSHGDLLLPGDRGYKILKSIIRNPLVVSMARLVHPDLLSAFARVVSKGSKIVTGKRQEPLARKLSRIAFDTYFDEGNDIFIMGHVHYPVHKTSGNKEFVILGDWIEHFSYAVLCEGKIALKYFRDQKPG